MSQKRGLGMPENARRNKRQKNHCGKIPPAPVASGKYRIKLIEAHHPWKRATVGAPAARTMWQWWFFNLEATSFCFTFASFLTCRAKTVYFYFLSSCNWMLHLKHLSVDWLTWNYLLKGLLSTRHYPKHQDTKMSNTAYWFLKHIQSDNNVRLNFWYNLLITIWFWLQSHFLCISHQKKKKGSFGKWLKRN